MIPSLVLFVLVSAAAQDTPFVRLSPAAGPGQGPYQSARVEIDNRLPAPIDAIHISSPAAPTVKATLIVPPSQKGELTLLLPATSPLQSYEVKLWCNGQAIATQRATLAWPAEKVRAAAFRDPDVGIWTESKADWPDIMRAKSAVLLGLLVALGLLCQLLRWPWASATSALLIAALMTWSAWRLLAEQPTYELHLYQVQTSAGPSGTSRPATEDVIVIQPLRSVPDLALSCLCYGVTASGNPPPLTVEPQRNRTHMHLRAGQVQVLKMAEPPTSQPASRDGGS